MNAKINMTNNFSESTNDVNNVSDANFSTNALLNSFLLLNQHLFRQQGLPQQQQQPIQYSDDVKGGIPLLGFPAFHAGLQGYTSSTSNSSVVDNIRATNSIAKEESITTSQKPDFESLMDDEINLANKRKLVHDVRTKNSKATNISSAGRSNQSFPSKCYDSKERRR